MDVNPAVRGIIFDKDGTLFDFRTTWEAWAAAFLMRITGGDAARARDIGQEVGFSIDTMSFAMDSVVIAGTPEEVAHALGPHVPEFDQAGLVSVLNGEAARAPQAEAVPLFPLLQKLSGRGLRLGVATNDAIEPARAHLQTAGVEQCFDFVAGFDSGYGAKPDPGQLLAFCEETGLAPAEVIMVGDSLHDLAAGRAAGMRSIGVLTGMAAADTLLPFAVAVLDDIGGLPQWLDGDIDPDL